MADSSDDSDGFGGQSLQGYSRTQLNTLIDREITFAEKIAESVRQGLPDTAVVTMNVPSVNSEILDAQLRAARMRSFPEAIRQPWERGTFGQIFGMSSRPQFLRNTWLENSVPLPAVITASTPLKPEVPKPVKNLWVRPVFSSAVFKIKRAPTPECVGDPLRFRALARLRCIITMDLNSSQVGRQLVDYILDGRAEVLIEQTIEDTFAKKATQTLLKRSSSLLKYIAFCRAHFSAASLVFKEQWIYAYLNWLRTNDTSPSAGKSFLEALNFVTFTIGPEILDLGWRSSRVLGAAESMYIKKSPLHQADPLTVLEVKLFHHILTNSSVLLDKIVAGFMLFCIYASCRWSDAQKPRTWLQDMDGGTGYLELGSTSHKTASNSERKTTICPFVATSPGLGALEPGWINQWLQCREEAGLTFVDDPTLPEIFADGSFGTKPMTASAGTAWLRELQQTYGPMLDKNKKKTSHSLKSTILSWAAKRPLDKDTRRALGHHIDSTDTSVGTYSRDFLFAALIQLDVMLQDIVRGDFDPDSSRSQRAIALKRSRSSNAQSSTVESQEHAWVRDDTQQVGVAFKWPQLEGEQFHESALTDPYVGSPQHAKLTQCSTASEPSKKRVASKPAISSSDDSSSTDSASSSEASIPAPAEEEDMLSSIGLHRPDCISKPFTDSNGFELPMVQHIKSGMLHARETPSKLFCGRVYSRFYAVVKSDLILRWPKCELCVRRTPNPISLPPKPKSSPPTPQASSSKASGAVLG